MKYLRFFFFSDSRMVALRVVSRVQQFVRSFADFGRFVALPLQQLNSMDSRPSTSDAETQCSPPPPPSDNPGGGCVVVGDKATGGGCAAVERECAVEEADAELTTDGGCSAGEGECAAVEADGELTTNKRKLPDGTVELVRNKPKKARSGPQRPGFSDERFNETSYYLENGLRKVYPYYFTFTTYTKGRWVGRTLADVFGEEFRSHSADVYERHIKEGLLTINNERVAADYVLKHNDLLANVVHRHEVPVTRDPIEILHMDQEVVVVNKPASLPVHPCGRYRHNTVVFLLAKEHGLRDLKTVHRLDRLTSGVLIFGRTREKAAQLESQIRARRVHKRYVCRVEGRFEEVGRTVCVERIEVLSHKIGVCKVSPYGKVCCTVFRSAGYDEATNTSVVLCEPLSGRMHQIRVHLQWMGHPIVNDPLYNDTIFGPQKGREGDFGGKTDEELVRDLIRAHNVENWHPNADGQPLPPTTPDVSEKTTTAVDACTQTGMELPDSRFDPNKASVDPYCLDCRFQYRDPEPKNLVMYLHAYKYSGPGWEYKTPMPTWAKVKQEEP